MNTDVDCWVLLSISKTFAFAERIPRRCSGYAQEMLRRYLGDAQAMLKLEIIKSFLELIRSLECSFWASGVSRVSQALFQNAFTYCHTSFHYMYLTSQSCAFLFHPKNHKIAKSLNPLSFSLLISLTVLAAGKDENGPRRKKFPRQNFFQNALT